MKTFLIAAGLLMTGASVYGVVDYNKRQHTKEFKELYNEKHEQELTISTKKEAPVTNEVTELKTVPDITVAVEKEPVKNEARKNASKKSDVKNKKKNRTLRLKEFSRAPLKD